MALPNDLNNMFTGQFPFWQQPASAWYPEGGFQTPMVQRTGQAFVPDQGQFKPSFSSSLPQMGPKGPPNFSGISAYGQGQESSIRTPVAMTEDAQPWYMNGEGFGPQKPSYLNTPQSQWTGDMMEAYLKAHQPSNAGAYANMALQGVQTVGQLGLGIAGLVKGAEAFDFQKQMALTNLANSKTNYNDRVRSNEEGRHSASAWLQSRDAIEAAIAKRQMK